MLCYCYQHQFCTRCGIVVSTKYVIGSSWYWLPITLNVTYILPPIQNDCLISIFVGLQNAPCTCLIHRENRALCKQILNRNQAIILDQMEYIPCHKMEIQTVGTWSSLQPLGILCNHSKKTIGEH